MSSIFPTWLCQNLNYIIISYFYYYGNVKIAMADQKILLLFSLLGRVLLLVYLPDFLSLHCLFNLKMLCQLSKHFPIIFRYIGHLNRLVFWKDSLLEAAHLLLVPWLPSAPVTQHHCVVLQYHHLRDSPLPLSCAVSQAFSVCLLPLFDGIQPPTDTWNSTREVQLLGGTLHVFMQW